MPKSVLRTSSIVRIIERAEGPAVYEAARVLAREITARVSAKQYPPASRPGEYPAVRTGRFSRSIRVSRGGRYATVYSAVGYGHWLNVGTTRMRPRPWLGRTAAVQVVQERMRRAAAREMRRRTRSLRGGLR